MITSQDIYWHWRDWQNQAPYWQDMRHYRAIFASHDRGAVYVPFFNNLMHLGKAWDYVIASPKANADKLRAVRSSLPNATGGWLGKRWAATCVW